MSTLRIAAPIALIAVLIAGTASADNAYGDDELIIAVLDTGVRPTHGEFTFGGPADPDDQFVGWWDFTNTLVGPFSPAPGQAWDPRNPMPYDDNGHGTATASLAAGANVEPLPKKEPSFAPGTKLAIAKVCDSSGACGGDIAGAMRWATDTIGADVISISIGSNVPAGDVLSSVHEMAGYARRAGVLTVVSNGNGLMRAGVPVPGWSTSNGDSTNVLSVGAADPVFQFASTYDPEVAARYWDVAVASHVCDACYTTTSGTSFAAPLVAGMAATAMAEAIGNGVDPTPDYIERLLKFSARDTETPPVVEGYGVLDGEQFPIVLTNAAAGTLPTRPDPDPNAFYVDTLTAALRDLVSNKLDGESRGFVPTGAGTLSEPGWLGDSTFTGVVDGETFTLTTAPGEQVYLSIMAPPDRTPAQYHIRVFDSADDILLMSEQVAASPWSSDINPVTATFRSPVGGSYTVLVHGAFGSSLAPVPFDLQAQGTSGTLTFQGQDTYATNITLLE